MIIAGIWHFIIKRPLFEIRHTKVVEYKTQFSNQCIIQTTPLSGAEKIDIPPEFRRLFVNPKLSPGEILQVHLDRVSTYRQDHPEVIPYLVHTLRAVFACGQQQAKIKADYRRKSRDSIHYN